MLDTEFRHAPQPALLTDKRCADLAGCSRSHWHAMVREKLAPPPAIKIGTRFTRWSSVPVGEWLRDPAAWIAKNTPAETAEAA